MFRRLSLLVLVSCLLLESCTRPPGPPVPDAELQAAFQGPLCTRLNGVEWPCSDTDGHLWKQWYGHQWAYRNEQSRHAQGVENFKSFVLGTVGGFGRSYGHYHYYGTITTHCAYGRTRSTCTTKY